MPKYDKAAAIFDARPTVACPVGGGGTGAGGATGAPAEETGDPQIPQNDASSGTADPHFEHDFIFPPVPLRRIGLTNPLTQKLIYYKL